MNRLSYDIVIIGASLGGVAAALRAHTLGAQVCILEASSWVGGQFTNQGVCKPDENKFIETVGSTASYRNFRHRCRTFYRNNFTLSDSGAKMPLFYPGGGWDAAQPQFSVEPKVADAILKQMLAEVPNVHLRSTMRVTDAEVVGDRIISVTALDSENTATIFDAAYFLDATDLGEFLPRVLHDDEWTVGAESQADTHEPSAPLAANRTWLQPITFVIALEHRIGGSYTILKPAEYDELKAEQDFTIVDGPDLKTMFAGDSWTTTMWNYRRYILASNFNDPRFQFDLSMINTGSNDYQRSSIPTGDAKEDAAVVARARQAALSYLYWLQTECPRDDRSGFGYPELRPNQEAFDTIDGVAQVPYIRESRRILALTRIVEQDVSRASNTGTRARLFNDSCGIGTYAYMDGHALKGANPPNKGFWIDVSPLQIPASALVPKRVLNLLAACKNIGTTHITNGVYRLHPLEWNIGEAAGALAAFAVSSKAMPREIVSQDHLLRAYQRLLLRAGVPLFWWTDIPYGDPLFEASQMAAVTGVMTGDDNSDMTFRPDSTVTSDELAAFAESTKSTLPANLTTRRSVVQWLDANGYV